MEVKITLHPDSHRSLLRYVPEESPAHRALKDAQLVLSYINKKPREYDVDCDENVARSLLRYASENCPEVVKEIEFAIRVAGLGRKPRPRGIF